MDTPYLTRPSRRPQTEIEVEDFYEQKYHAPYLHQNCQQCDDALLESINEGILENDADLLNTINEAYFNEELVNSFDVYRHFHPLYNFNHNPYQNSFSPVALPNKRLVNTLQTGDFILMRLVLSGKTFQGIIINPEWLNNDQIRGFFSNSNKPGYFVRAYGNTGGNRNENIFLRIADNKNITSDNIIILRKLLPDNSANNADLSFPESVQFAQEQEDQQEYFTEGNEYEDDSSVPALISRDITPALETLYVAIDLGLRKECVRKKPPEYNCIESLKFNVEPKTGIFIPATFKVQPQVDLLIYLHGHKSGFVSHGRDLPIDRFWDAAKKPKFAFREIVNASGRNIVLVAPTLGPLSQAGNLTSSEGFTGFVSKVIASLSSYCSLYSGQQTPAVRSIILAAHSGGGEPMRRIAKLAGTNDYANFIKECWGFDCTYSSKDPSEWYNWANTNPDKSLYLFSIPGTATARNAALIQAKKPSLPNIHLTASGTGDHNSVPKVYMAERLAAITTLANETASLNFPEDDFTISNSEDTAYTTHYQLRSGARGSEVIYLQQRLNYHDTADGNAIKQDGIFGPETKKAVLSFQNSKGLAADGVVGAKTWAALDADKSRTPGSYPPEVPPDYYTPPIFPPEIIPVHFIPPVVPVTFTVEQIEWTVNPNIHARYKTWQAYKAVRDQVVGWGVTNPAVYIESAIHEWNANTSIHGHFDRNFDGDPHRSYLNLKRLYQAKGIADPASYFNTNIVSITFFNRTTPGHRDLQTALNTAQANLTAAGNTFTLDRGTWSFVPRTFNANINRLSNHALGKAIDINPSNNPHITSADEISVIDSVCSAILPRGLLREANPNTLINASTHFQQTFNDAWVAQQTQIRLLNAIRKKRAKLNEYAARGFLNLPVTLIGGLQNAGLNWGGSWTSAKDFMHFELPDA